MGEAKQKSEAVVAAERIYEAVRDGGIEALSSLFGGLLSDDFAWHPALVGAVEGARTYVGAREYAAYVDDFNSTFDEVRVGSAAFEEVAPGLVLITGSLHVTGSGSGVPVETEAAYVFQFDGGQAISGRTFFSRGDAEEAAKALA